MQKLLAIETLLEKHAALQRFNTPWRIFRLQDRILQEIPRLHAVQPRSEPHSDEDQVGFETKAVGEGSRHQSGCDHCEHSLIACKMKEFLSLQEFRVTVHGEKHQVCPICFLQTHQRHKQTTPVGKQLFFTLSACPNMQASFKVRQMLRLVWLQVMTRSCTCKEKAWDSLLWQCFADVEVAEARVGPAWQSPCVRKRPLMKRIEQLKRAKRFGKTWKQGSGFRYHRADCWLMLAVQLPTTLAYASSCSWGHR